MYIEFLEKNRFTEYPTEGNPQEEAFARDWEALISRHAGPAWELLREICVELSFPICGGQSKSQELLLALKRGILPACPEGAWVPAVPEGIRVYLHPTPAGRVPVIECGDDSDFIRLLQSLAYHCEPHIAPVSQGAAIIKNYNNWARVNMNREGFTCGIPKDPALYRDYIMLLSHRNYSGIEPEAFLLEKEEWRQKSLILRLEHETAHYMTQRFYHSAKNEIHDEIVADFMGLTAAFGDYDPVKFLTFMGLENYPGYRLGGRLEMYLPVGIEGFGPLCGALSQVAHNISGHYRKYDGDRIKMFHTLCRTSAADMARGNFA